jgi:cobalt-zinc-cadmium efflux system membrane fusion protein
MKYGTRSTPRFTMSPILVLLCAGSIVACGGHEEGTHHDDPSPRSQFVRLKEDAVRAASIEVTVVSRETFHPHVTASGVIRPVAQRSVRVRAVTGGMVVRLLVDVGDRVEEVQELATIEGPEVAAAVARYRSAVARRKVARESLERATGLLDMKAISRAELELRTADASATAAEVDAAHEDLVRLGLDPSSALAESGPPSRYSVISPMKGVVIQRHVSPGLLVEKEEFLFEIADLSTVWAIADIYQQDLGQIRAHGEVEVRSDAYPGQHFMGRIELIEPTLDEASRTAHVRVALDNRSGRLLPGLFVTVAVPLRGASEAQATAVPDGAVQKISGIPSVFIERERGVYELRPVEMGREAHGMVEILHGLQEGDRVVSRGAFILKSELLKSTIVGDEH